MSAPLTQDLIKEQVDAESYRRGVPYFERGAITRARRSGRIVRALCEGSRPEPYRVRAELGPGTILHAYCSCPVGASGQCKHVAATLLALLHTPHIFHEVEDLSLALATCSPARLGAMLTYALGRFPELEIVLEMTLPVDPVRHEQVDEQLYREQARDIMREVASHHGAASQAVDALRPLLILARGFASRGEYHACLQIVGALLHEVCAQHHTWHDGDGFLGSFAAQLLSEHIQPALAKDLPAQARHRALDALALVASATSAQLPGEQAARHILSLTLEEEERDLLAAQLRHHAPPGQQDSWLLLQLESRDLDDQAYAMRCRALGREDAWVQHLLERERVEEALAVTSAAEDAHVLALANAFVERGLGELVEAVVRQRYALRGELALLSWLGEQYAARGEHALALSTALACFYRAPALSSLHAVRQAARPLAQWEVLRPSALATLRERGEWEVLLRAYLEEGDFDGAFEALEVARQHGRVSAAEWVDVQAELAERARHTHPEQATALLEALAEQLIKKRSLANFKRAAELLAMAYQLRMSAGEEAQWGARLEELHARYGRFQGLREALKAVGLLP